MKSLNIENVNANVWTKCNCIICLHFYFSSQTVWRARRIDTTFITNNQSIVNYVKYKQQDKKGDKNIAFDTNTSIH